MSEIILYQGEDGNVKVSVLFDEDTFWLNQNALAELFDVDRSVISKHLRNIFDCGELEQNSVCAKFAQTAADGKNYQVLHYNLDAVISVGYRVNSKKATQFRIWATKTLKEYMIKGFVLNDEMLKNGRPFGKDYFDELLERIREIRASERRFYQKITDIYAECSYDYDKNADVTKEFFRIVQNKLLFAATGQTAPELLSSRLDSNKPHMGLTSWKNAPNRKVLKQELKLIEKQMKSMRNFESDKTENTCQILIKKQQN